ncbi:Probable GTP-binding protein EngB [Candidatus Providencia siddallii]|uniref:Probable GTP-binding protein EngB n=1 Tax=Candidatus Providencia siddallii TaxID=1715285 RepID=A0A0M6W712_9GAMM|nr:Probable GTP-binding protein EngB [Candidatus Providencia siddallii]
MISKKINYQITKFIISAINVNQLPKDTGVEIAFIGRSNSGKSSALNSLIQKKNFARTSKTAGKTKFINLFEVKNGIRIADLPGYGYANISKKIKSNFINLINEYLQKRKCIKGIVIMMDIRNPLNIIDLQLIKWILKKNIHLLILLTKADKLSFNDQKKQLFEVYNKLSIFKNIIEVECFSIFKNIGINKLRMKLKIWFTES